MSIPLQPDEEATVRAFIVKERQDRFLELLPNPKRRRRITDSLAHPDPAWFEAKYIKQIPPPQRNPVGIAKLLHGKGAGKMCWVISEDRQLDGREAELDSLLSEIVGNGMGAIVSCVPGKLAYVETEIKSRFILEK